MSVELNHTIVHAKDKRVSASFLAALMDLPEPKPFGHFLVVQTANGVSLDFIDAGDYEIQSRHFAFLVSEAEFDAIFGKLEAQGIDYWADPMGKLKGEINRHDGGRGCYFRDPAGHWLEIITRPYGSGGG